jgi:hypothetical protein
VDDFWISISSLESMATTEEEEVSSLSIKELKDLINRAGLSDSSCVDKSELVAQAIIAKKKLDLNLLTQKTSKKDIDFVSTTTAAEGPPSSNRLPKKTFANTNFRVRNADPGQCSVIGPSGGEVAAFFLNRLCGYERFDHKFSYDSSFRFKLNGHPFIFHKLLQCTDTTRFSYDDDEHMEPKWINHSYNLQVPEPLKTLGFSQELFELMRYENDLVWEHANTEWLKYKRMIREGNPGIGYVDTTCLVFSLFLECLYKDRNTCCGDCLQCILTLLAIPMSLVVKPVLAFVAWLIGVMLNILSCRCCTATTEVYMKYVMRQEELHPELTFESRQASIKRKYKEAIARIKAHPDFAHCEANNVTIVYREGTISKPERVRGHRRSYVIRDFQYAYSGIIITKLGGGAAAVATAAEVVEPGDRDAASIQVTVVASEVSIAP